MRKVSRVVYPALGEPLTLRSRRIQWEHPQPCAASWLALPLGLAGLSVAAVADDAKLRSYGRHLAQECTGCHRIDGVDNGIPSIVGWDTSGSSRPSSSTRTGERTNPVMVSVAKSLDEDQVAALAAYYGSLPKPPSEGSQPQKR